MLFAELSDAVWLGIIGGVVMLIKEYFDRQRDAAAAAKADLLKAEVKVATEAVVVSESTIATIAEKQDEQHKAWNSRLDEYKRLIETAELAKGVLLGRAQLQAEMDAKAVGQITQAAAPHAPAVAPQGSQAVPVVVLPDPNAPPMPVKETK